MHFIFSTIRLLTESNPPIPIDINLKGMAIASIKIIWLDLKYSSPNIEKKTFAQQLKRKTAKSLAILS